MYLRLLSLVLVFLLMASFSAPRKPYRNWRKVPVELQLPGIAGDTLKLSSLRGKIVVVEIWSSQCYPCYRIHRELAKLYKIQQSRKAAGAKNFEIFSISIDADKAAWKEAIRTEKSAWPYHVNDPGFLNTEFADRIALERAPRLLIIDENGLVAEENVQARYLQFYLERMLK